MDAFDDFLQPMLIELGSVTKLTFGGTTAPVDANVCPGCTSLESDSDSDDPDVDSGTC
jgi:hypothetical protein